MAVTALHYAKWGTRQVPGAATYGVVTSFEKISDMMSQNETDEDGAVCRMVMYDERTRIVFCVQASASATVPEIGRHITVDGVSGWIQHAELIEQNQAFKKIRITMEKYKNCDTVG